LPIGNIYCHINTGICLDSNSKTEIIDIDLEEHGLHKYEDNIIKYIKNI